jgi:hypothetical protein
MQGVAERVVYCGNSNYDNRFISREPSELYKEKQVDVLEHFGHSIFVRHAFWLF